MISSLPVCTFPPGGPGPGSPAGDQSEVDNVISGMGYTDIQKLGQGGMGMAFKCTSSDGSLRVVKASFFFLRILTWLGFMKDLKINKE